MRGLRQTYIFLASLPENDGVGITMGCKRKGSHLYITSILGFKIGLLDLLV